MTERRPTGPAGGTGAVARGEAMFSHALSEPQAGSAAANMKARAVRDGDSFVLNGTKRWITNAGVASYYTVMAVTGVKMPCSGRDGAETARWPGGEAA